MKLLERIGRLVGTPSVSALSPAHDMPNRPVIDLLAEWLEGAGFACEPSQKPPASLVLPQPQRLRAGAGVEGTWDMVMEKPEQEAARPPAQVVSLGRPPPFSLFANPAALCGHHPVGHKKARNA